MGYLREKHFIIFGGGRRKDHIEVDFLNHKLFFLSIY